MTRAADRNIAMLSPVRTRRSWYIRRGTSSSSLAQWQSLLCRTLAVAFWHCWSTFPPYDHIIMCSLSCLQDSASNTRGTSAVTTIVSLMVFKYCCLPKGFTPRKKGRKLTRRARSHRRPRLYRRCQDRQCHRSIQTDANSPL